MLPAQACARTGRRFERLALAPTGSVKWIRSRSPDQPVSAISCAESDSGMIRGAMRASRIDCSIALRQNLQERFQPRHARNRRRVEHHASADGHDRRKLPHDEAVSRQQQGGLGQAQLGQRSFSRRRFVSCSEEHDCGDGFKSVGVKVHARPGLSRGFADGSRVSDDIQARSSVKVSKAAPAPCRAPGLA